MPVIIMSLIYFILGYLSGSIPFGLIVSRLFNLGNLREIGSGNIGATNVLRTGNKWAAILTLLFDAAKGALVITLVRQYDGHDLDYKIYIVALGAVVGHIFPVWLNFRGGKGVATVGGCTLALNIWVGLGLVGTWIVIFIWQRVSSLSAIIATIMAPIIAYSLGDYHLACWFTFISPLVLFTHRTNIKRLLQKKEISLDHISNKK